MRPIRTLVLPAIVAILALNCTTVPALRPEKSEQAAVAARVWQPVVADRVKRYIIGIDDAGFVDLRHLNFRNPPSIDDDGSGTQRLVFENRTIDRRVTVSLPVIAGSDINPPFAKEDGFTATCDPSNHQCSASASIDPGGQAFIGARFLVPNKLTAFSVTFSLESDPPTNSSGYVVWRQTPAPKQLPPPSNVLRILGGINGQVEPKLPLTDPTDITKPLTLSTASPYDGGERRYFKSTVNLDGTLFVPAWGSGEGTITFKDGELGRDSTLNLSASKYRVNLISENGLALRFGKFVFAAPSNKVSVNEAGEGFQFDLSRFIGFHGAFSASVITKRQRPPDATTKPNHDDNETLLQYTGIPFHTGADDRSAAFFRTASFYALFGRDENRLDEHSYATTGSEVTFAVPPTKTHGYLSGSSSLYLSRRGAGAFDGSTHGGVFFTRAAYTPQVSADPKAPTDTFTGLLGIGSADNSATTRDEGYVGEGQGFTPDIIFFSLLSRPLRVGGTPGIGSGLGNKRYLGLQYSTTRWSLLREFARLLLADDEIRSWSTVISVHKYDLRQARLGQNGRNAGWEGDLKFVVETLPKVRVNLGMGYYAPGNAVNDIIKRRVWAVTSGVSIDPN